MTKYREIVRLSSLGLSQQDIADSCSVSKKTVNRVLKRAKEIKLSWPLDENMTDAVIAKTLFPSKNQSSSGKRLPDYDYIRKELLRNGVNKKLLWTEYLEECRQSGEDPLMYSQFCYHIQQNEQQRRATMHVPRHPGEQIEVDWAGDPAHIIDPDTGEIIDAWLFVGVMSYSMYPFVEAFINEKQQAWITAHVHMYEYFGGVTRILVPDNTKTAVIHNGWYTQELNTVYHEMAEHYNTAIIPARIKAPKDKPNAEGSVGIISTWITAALRKLPTTPYELAEWKSATVQFNYHISIGGMLYSVPYEFIKRKVDVRITDSVVEIFYNHNRIASHRRLYGRKGQYSTVTEHMPEDHQKYLEWNGDRFRKWAQKIGSNTYKVVDAILTSQRVEQQSYRSCMGLLKLANKYSDQRLEAACKKALTYTASPSYKSVKNILAAGKDKDGISDPNNETHPNPHAITRGADYYRR